MYVFQIEFEKYISMQMIYVRKFSGKIKFEITLWRMVSLRRYHQMVLKYALYFP